MFKKVILYIVLVYTFLGFVAIPLILKPQIINIVAKETHATIEIDSIFFNPFAFYLNISGVKLSSLNDKELVYIKEIFLNIEAYSLFNSAIHLKNFILEEPRISLVLDKDKKINFSKIIKNTPEKNPEDTNSTTDIPRIILDKIAIIQGSVNYEDYSRGDKFSLGLDSIGFELHGVDTNDLNSSDAHIRFHTLLSDGGFIDFKSEVVGFEPFILKGSLEFEASKLYTQWRYMKDSLNLEVADGKFSFDTKYYLNLDALEEFTISDLNVNLDKLRIKPKGNHKDILTLNSLYITDASIKPLIQDVHVKKLGLHSLDITALRDEKGNIDWLEYIKINNSSENTEVKEKIKDKPEQDTKPWSVVVDSLALEKVKINFNDKGIQPSVNHTLNELNIFAQDITLEGKEPLHYQIDLLLNNTLRCNAEGSVSHKVLDAKARAQCSDLDVIHYLPYIDDIARKELDVYDVELRSLTAGFDANLTAKDSNSSVVIDVNDANLHLNNFALNKRSTHKRVVTFSDFDVTGIQLNTQRKDVNITDTTLKYLNIRTARLDDGSLSVENLVVPKASKPSHATKQTKNTSKEKEYRVRLKKVALKGAKVGFEDKMLSPSVHSKIDNIYLSAYNIDSSKYSWMQYYLSARINEAGKVKASGSVRHAPLKQKGSIELNRIALKDLNPYIDEHAYVYLNDGYLSFKTKVQYAPSAKSPDLSVDGSFTIEDLFVHDSRDDTTLFSFAGLDLKSFTLETSPNRLFVDEVDINSFYVKALIDANKTMNLATLMRGSDDANMGEDFNNTVAINDKTKESVALENNTTKELTLEKITVTEDTDPFPVKVMKVNVKDGSAVFADASLPIDFKTDIHDLNGAVYGISSSPNETSYIDIVGEVDAYGSTKLKGSINAASPKAYTDINFNFKNLNLSAMSGYSATFAGHKIDKGKLFVDLNYDIKESVLMGENSIIIKNIELGDELVVEGGSSLPLGFVIGLLEDNDGVIDIDMPVRGNVDEPDFKYGALVFKTFANLILKAIALPFSFLGSMLGIDGDTLKFVEFESGSNAIIPTEREKLDTIAKLLSKRPKMSLGITGSYDVKVDTEAIQKIKLSNLIVKKSGAKNEKERINAMNIGLLEDIYEDARDDDKIEKIEDALEKKYEGDDAKFERAYLQALIKECAAIQIVTVEELQALAKERAKAIKQYLVETKGIDIARVQGLEIVEVATEHKQLVQTKLEVVVK